jgi:hydrogenase nickel incorporation protein HypB
LTTKIEIEQDLNEYNNRIAAQNREKFKAKGIFVLNIMGSPGSGKTTLLENILPKLQKQLRTAVIEGDIATQNDALRIRKIGVTALQINTDGGCHLDAKMIESQLAQLDLGSLDLIIIENVGNLVCPAEFDLGEDLLMVVLSVAEGEDKPMKYPLAFLNAKVAVLTKTDLLPYLDADIKVMKKYITGINPKINVFEAGKKDGIYDADELVKFIIGQVKQK